MAVVFSHGSASWRSLVSFNRFRREVAAHEGVRPDDSVWLHLPCAERDITGRPAWRGGSTPIRDFLGDSGYAGTLSPEQCVNVEPRLRQIVTELWGGALPGTLGAHEYSSGIALCDGMRQAAAAGDVFELVSPCSTGGQQRGNDR